jgi:cell division GTPase FtsZ
LTSCVLTIQLTAIFRILIMENTVTVCTVQPGFGLVLFGPKALANTVVGSLLSTAKQVQHIGLDAPDATVQAAISQALGSKDVACVITHAPHLSARIARLQAAVQRATRQREFTATLLLTSDSAALPSDATSLADAVLATSEDPVAIISSMVNGITHAEMIGVDTLDLTHTLSQSPGRWHAAVAYATGPQGAELAAQAALQALRQTVSDDFGAAYLSVTRSSEPLGLGDFRAAHNLARSNCKPVANFCLTRLRDESLGKRIRVTLFATLNFAVKNLR